MEIWAIVNQKGGVGKTTTTVSLGGLLAQQGKRVLLMDLDPHGSLTSYFRFDPDTVERSTYHFFDKNFELNKELVESTMLEINGAMKLVPASPALATVERKASVMDGMGLRVSQALAHVWEDYDHVLIDSPPILGALMINALAASERLLVPVQTEFLAMKGLERMIHTLSMVSRSLRKELPYVIVPTMFDRRTQASTVALRGLRNEYPNTIWPSMIPIDTRLRDASRQGILPSVLDPQGRAVRGYRSLLKWMSAERPAIVPKGMAI